MPNPLSLLMLLGALGYTGYEGLEKVLRQTNNDPLDNPSEGEWAQFALLNGLGFLPFGAVSRLGRRGAKAALGAVPAAGRAATSSASSGIPAMAAPLAPSGGLAAMAPLGASMGTHVPASLGGMPLPRSGLISLTPLNARLWANKPSMGTFMSASNASPQHIPSQLPDSNLINNLDIPTFMRRDLAANGRSGLEIRLREALEKPKIEAPSASIDGDAILASRLPELLERLQAIKLGSSPLVDSNIEFPTLSPVFGKGSMRWSGKPVESYDFGIPDYATYERDALFRKLIGR